MKKNLLFSTNNVKIDNKFVFLDTNIFVYASENNTFKKWLINNKEKNGVSFTTIDIVSFEYTRNCKDSLQIAKKRELINLLASVPIQSNQFFDIEFSMIMSKLVSDKNCQFADFLLASALMKYSKNREDNQCYLLTADIKAFTSNLFKIEGILNISVKSNMVAIYLISFNKEEYIKELEKIE